MVGKRKHSSGDGGVMDANAAMRKALAYKPPDEIYMTGQLNRFIKAKARKVGVTPSMVVPSVLAVIANTMNLAEFELTEGWTTPQNLFILCVANKGAGKTPAYKTFLEALAGLEKKQKEEWDIGGDIDNEEDLVEDIEDEFWSPENDEVQKKSRRKRSKKIGVSDKGRGDMDFVEKQKFHPKQRIVDSITPEALFLTMYYGTGVLLIRSDEFKGFYDKFIIGAQNMSSFCSAYSGEPFNYTTVARGALDIADNRLTILGSIQPGPLMEMINGAEDYQGFWDRFLITPGATDYSVDFEEKLRPLTDEEKFDVERFLRIINENHQERRTYRPTTEAIDALKRIKKELDGIDTASGFGNETSGMTSKGFTNTLKLASVFACGRMTVEMMEQNHLDEEKELIDFLVTAEDVYTAFEFVKLSQETYKSLKLSLTDETSEIIEPNLLKYDEIDEDSLALALPKIVKMYEKAKDGEVLVSLVRKSNLYPPSPRWNDQVIIMVMEKYGIAKKVSVTQGNRLVADVIRLTMRTDDEDVIAVFRFMWERAKILKPPVKFDPLGLFEGTTVN